MRMEVGVAGMMQEARGMGCHMTHMRNGQGLN